MTEYYIPTRESETEFVEKRSRFIGHVWRVESEEEARMCIEATRKKDHAANHHCWCYVIQDGPVRYSDDGEPQGTAGQPMLNVFQREGVVNVCCVVTRYFGGTLLGAGGLVRAYTKGAKIAVDAAGKSMKRVWSVLYIPCPYTFYERVKLEVEAFEGVIRDTQFAAEVELEILVAQPKAQAFLDRILDMTSGMVEGLETAQEYRAFPVNKE